MALKIIKTSDLEEISTCSDESFLTITQKISEDNFISNKMQIKNLPLNNYYKKADIDELLKTYSKTTHNHDFNSLSNLPTTLSGYGITDVYTKTEINNKNFLTEHQDISSKQNKLKAGTNITISDDNTISADGVKINDTKTDTTTTYSSSKIETIKSELQQSIDNVSTGGSTALTNYYTKAESDDKYSLKTHNHAISDITNLQTTLDGKASSTHNHDSVYVKQDGSTPIISRQQLKMGSYVFEAHAGNGTEGYALVAEFKILRNYQNTPIKIELARRGVLYSNITIQFKNTDSPDPTLQNFVYEGSDCMAYMAKADTSTWNLYIRKTEGYDVIFITKYSNPNSAITTTWKESIVTSLPEGGTYASPLQHAISEITDLQTTLDSKAPKVYENQVLYGSLSSNFRTWLIGTNKVGGFAKPFRKDDGKDSSMPQFGAGIAWGQADTNGMLCVDYANPTAYIAGGNGDKLLWSKQLAWKDDLTSYSLTTHNHDTVYAKISHTHDYLPLSGGNVSGNIILNNTIKISSKDKGGTVRDLIWMNNTTDGEVVVGGGSNQVTFDIPTPKSLKIWCDGTQKSYEVYHSGNDPWRIKTLGKADMDTTVNSRGQGFLMKEVYNGTSSGYPKEYGNVLRMGGTGSNELLFEWCDGTAGMIYHRCLRDVGTSWTPWRRLAYADELNNYLPKSGGTMTGTISFPQGVGISSTSAGGSSILVENTSSINIGLSTKDLSLNCRASYVNGSMVLTAANHMFHMKNIFHVLFERNDGTINKNINTCFASSSGTFTAPEAGQYLVMCSGYKLSTSGMYIACAVSGTSGNQNTLYTTGSSGFTIITLSAKQTLMLYECPAGNINNACISAMSYINMLIAKIL